MQQDFGRLIASFEAQEHPAYARSWAWYAAFILIILVILSFSIVILQDLIFASTVFFATALYAYARLPEPKINTYKLYESGLLQGNHWMPLAQIYGFMVLPQHHKVYLSLPYRGWVGLLVTDYEPLQHALLTLKIPEMPSYEPLLDRMIRLLQL